MKHPGLYEREFLLEDARDPLRALRGVVAAPPGARALPAVLVLHGFKGFMDWGFYPELTRRLNARGFAVVRFNFSGSGVGADRERFTDEPAFFANSPSREVDDVERVRAWLDSGAVPEVDARRLALLGHSLGGAVALLHAAQRRDYRALVGWASVATFRRFPSEVEALWRRQGFVEIPNMRTKEILRLGSAWLEDLERHARALDVLDACRRLPTPTLLLHGTEDEAVPLAEGRALAEALGPARARLELVEGANHTFWAAHPLAGVPATLERVLQRTLGFLEGHLGPRAPGGSA